MTPAVLAAAAAIANARAGRRGAPPIVNVLDILPPALHAEVTEDAKLALDAAGHIAAGLPSAPNDETGWVIERDIHSQLHYWAGRGPEDWRTANEEALRFARRADAELMLTYHCGGIGRVMEHLWCVG